MKTILFSAALMAAAFPASAMEQGRSEARFTVGDRTLTGDATFVWQDIDSVLEIDANKNGLLEAEECDEARRFLGEYGGTLYQVQIDGETVSAAEISATLQPGSPSVFFHFRYPFDKTADAEDVVITFAGLPDFVAGQQQQLRVVDAQGTLISETTIGDADAVPLFPLPSKPAIDSLLNPAIPNSESATAAAETAPAETKEPPRFLIAGGSLLIAFSGSFWLIRRRIRN